jgi:hypothetical protein
LLAELQALHHTHREATRLFLMAASQGSLFDGGHRRTDSRCSAARAPSPH